MCTRHATSAALRTRCTPTGCSILVDQHGVTIAGCAAWEAAAQAGIRRAAVIETDGETLVIVKRTVAPEQRVRLTLADNRATDLSSWAPDRLARLHAEEPALAVRALQWSGRRVLCRPVSSRS